MNSLGNLATLLCLIFNINAMAQSIITTIAGNGTQGYTGDGGFAISACLDAPASIAFDSSGNLYFTDSNNHCVRKVSSTGIITTVAGNGTPGFSGDGGLATAAQFNYPSYIVVNSANELLISDYYNNRIRKVDGAGIITTIAGDGNATYAGDGGPAISASLYFPAGMVFDVSGNLYISDQQNNCIRKINSSGIISTFAGIGVQGYSGDGGQASAATFFTPFGITVDPAGNFYIADVGNQVVRKINSSGIVNTIVGNGAQGYSGDGAQAISASLNFPTDIQLDANNSIYISDNFNHCIRKVSSTGIISTLTGNGNPGFSGDGGPPSAAQLKWPYGLQIKTGTLYIADVGNNRIRAITMATTTEERPSGLGNLVFPNPCSNKIWISESVDFDTVKVFDVMGHLVLKSNPYSEFLDVSDLSEGVYFLSIENKEKNIIRKIIKL